jgi:hypothetical protein
MISVFISTNRPKDVRAYPAVTEDLAAQDLC